MKPACTCSFCLRGNLPWFCHQILLIIFFHNQFLLLFFLKKSVECQTMPVGSDLGLNCLQRLSADDTSYDNNSRNSESGIYIKLQEHQIFACLRYFADKLSQQPKPSLG